MGHESSKKIGLLIGAEKEWPAAFLAAVNQRKGVMGEMMKIGPTYMDEPTPYGVIVDRVSHDIPYYRAYLKYAAIQGTYIINDPLTKAIDQKFFGIALVQKLGLRSPRTVVLPNKDVDVDTSPDMFRNLKYPMSWDEIIDYVGVPAIYKDIKNSGRRQVRRVSNMDDLLQFFDESGTRTTILQQIIESDRHVHCFVIGQEESLCLQYTLADDKYLPTALDTDSALGKAICNAAQKITKAYKYDINMVEFVVKDNDFYVINGTNPVPQFDQAMMSPEHFSWCVSRTVDLAVARVKRPLPTKTVMFLQ